jgi:hypothetical protein
LIIQRGFTMAFLGYSYIYLEKFKHYIFYSKDFKNHLILRW